NANFESLNEYRDIESFNAYKEYVEVRGISPEIMMEYLKHISRDNARTPMQWDSSENAGFTAGTPWIPVNPNYPVINAKNQIHDVNSVFNYYKRLIQLRHEHEIIVYGTYELLLPKEEHLYVYTRTLGNEKLLGICNFSEDTIHYELPELFINNQKVLISNYTDNYEENIRA